MAIPDQFTILAADKPYAGRCSRCGTQDLGPRLFEAPWNGLKFVYCTDCRNKIEAKEAARAAEALAKYGRAPEPTTEPQP